MKSIKFIITLLLGIFLVGCKASNNDLEQNNEVKTEETVDNEVEYSAWSEWSNWGLDYNTHEESELLQIERKECYPYYAIRCINGHNNPLGTTCSTCGVAISASDNWVHLFTPDIPWSQATIVENKLAVKIEGQYWWVWNDQYDGAITASRIRTRAMDLNNSSSNANVGQYTYGPWSEWGTTPIQPDEFTLVETLTQYSFRTKNSVGQWSNWSEWTNNQMEPKENLEIKTRVIYRSKTKS